MQSTLLIVTFPATQAHHLDRVSTMLALLAKFFLEEMAFLCGGFGRVRSRTRRAWRTVLDIFDALHRMTPHQANATRRHGCHAIAALSAVMNT